MLQPRPGAGAPRTKLEMSIISVLLNSQIQRNFTVVAIATGRVCLLELKLLHERVIQSAFEMKCVKWFIGDSSYPTDIWFSLQSKQLVA